ncbi:MAG: aminotransferase class I/II-fold pyridoxal phosphate-dependent enzyme [Planctomycetes bacterium]|nr:aminotransferase class I/II-fold pyridoxal phosphate-dependent enzyme [Planctomycetota bacterium]
MNAEASARAAAGESILNATLGALMDDTGQLCVMPSVAEAITRVPIQRAAAYAPILGPPAYLKAVIADVFGDGPLAAQATAAATAGGTGAILHAITTFLDAGQALLTSDYFWAPYRIIASHTRRAVETFRMFDAEGRFDLRAFEEALLGQIARQGRVLAVLNVPCHNPTGYTLDESEWNELERVLARHAGRAPIAVLFDIAYAKFGHEETGAWVRHLAALAEHVQVLVAWSASKAFAQYGARVGALIALQRDDEERTRIRNALSFACRGTWSNCNHLGMLAVTDLLTVPEHRAASERERAALVELLAQRVEAFNAEAARYDLHYPRYEGGFFVAVFTPDAPATAAHMRELGVYVVPLGGAVRVALCSTPVAEIPRLVQALAAGVAAAGAGAEA